jgi:vitamin B12 transporter
MTTTTTADACSNGRQTDKQFFGRGEAVWSLFDGRFKNFFGLDYTNEWNHNVDPNSILVFRHLVPNHHYLL